MKRTTQNELKPILELHAKWLRGEPDGKKANLSGSDLSGSDLRWSDLRGSDLRGSNLSGSDLSGSDLSGSDLGTVLVYQIGPIGSRWDQLVIVRLADGAIEARTGCFVGNIDELRGAIANTHGDNEYARQYGVALATFEA